MIERGRWRLESSLKYLHVYVFHIILGRRKPPLWQSGRNLMEADSVASIGYK